MLTDEVDEGEKVKNNQTGMNSNNSTMISRIFHKKV